MSSKTSKQHRMDQPRANIDGSTARHTVNVRVASKGGEGNAAPGKHRRGKQGQ